MPETNASQQLAEAIMAKINDQGMTDEVSDEVIELVKKSGDETQEFLRSLLHAKLLAKDEDKDGPGYMSTFDMKNSRVYEVVCILFGERNGTALVMEYLTERYAVWCYENSIPFEDFKLETELESGEVPLDMIDLGTLANMVKIRTRTKRMLDPELDPERMQAEV